MSDVPQHDELPLPDYDHLPVGSLESRIKPLDSAGVESLLAYARAHADRVAVVQLLETRLHALGGGAQPTGASVGGASPENEPAPGGSRVQPETQGPKINPPSQGVPTNPAQPRT
jgi:hypothetical protein